MLFLSHFIIPKNAKVCQSLKKQHFFNYYWSIFLLFLVILQVCQSLHLIFYSFWAILQCQSLPKFEKTTTHLLIIYYGLYFLLILSHTAMPKLTKVLKRPTIFTYYWSIYLLILIHISMPKFVKVWKNNTFCNYYWSNYLLILSHITMS